MKNLKKVLLIIVGLQVSIALFVGCLFFYKLTWDDLVGRKLNVWVSATYFLFVLILCWLYRKKPFFAYTLLIVSAAIIGLGFYAVKPPPKHTFAYNWTTQKDTIQMPFTVGKSGRIYLEATVNDTTGLFVFDTGSGQCIIHETLVKNAVETSEDFMLTDAQGISQPKKRIFVDRFQVKDIVSTNVLFWPADSTTWHRKGIFEDRKEVAGVIGNTFLTNFVWDFDMVNHTVTLARSVKALEEINNETALPFHQIDHNWNLPVTINGDEKLVTLDFGCIAPLLLRDTIPLDKKKIHGWSKTTLGTAFAHTLADSVQKDTLFHFLAENVSLGNQSFDSVMCHEQTHVNVLGMPFIWAFERVVLDYPGKKIYLINRQTEAGKFDVRTISQRYRASMKSENFKAGEKGYFKLHTKYHADFIVPAHTESEDTVKEKYRVYGKARYWGRSMQDLDSIQCMDSVLLPNGNIQYAPFTIDMRKGNLY